MLRTILSGSLLFFIFIISTNGQAPGKKKPGFTPYASLNGQALRVGNATGPDGNVHHVAVPLLRLVRTRSASPKGTFLLIPGGGYVILELKGRIEKFADSLRIQGYNTATLDYHVSPTPATGDLASPALSTRDLALADALTAFRLLKSRQGAWSLAGSQSGIVGFASGGHLAARTLQSLGEEEQPDDLLLVSPVYLDETLPGTVLPAVMPPLNPRTRLSVVFPGGDSSAWTKACSEYIKTWKGYDERIDPSGNPAAIPVAGYAKQRHAEKLQLIAMKKFDLILLGNSITHNFEKPEYQPVWNQFFAPRNALNLGVSAYRTENILWNIANGELDGQSPKVVILEIGTNNIDEKNYPTRHTAGQLAGGIEAIVNAMRQKMPGTKIIILRCFPGCYGGPNPTSHRAILERASELVSRLADGKNIFYCDVNHVFLNLDGSINHAMMPDWLHPSPAGARAWVQAMEPLLSRLMGDSSLDREIPSNTAIVPVPKLEEDSYDWWERHAEVFRIKDSINPEIVLIGNSITHFWGGLPQLKYADGRIRQPNGPQSWASLFEGRRVLNLGFGWDRTQNVLWRLDNGELDGLHPRLVIIDIGTNNTSETQHARMNTAPEIVEGIRAVVGRVRSKAPGAKILLMAIFPREKDPQHPRRILINRVNKLLDAFAKEEKITLVDIGPRWLAPDGSILPGMTSDFTHPTEKGYQVWADSIRSFVTGP